MEELKNKSRKIYFRDKLKLSYDNLRLERHTRLHCYSYSVLSDRY